MSPSVPSGTLDDKKLILMVLERTVVFFDAGYLSKLSKYFGKGKYLKLDLVKFAKHLAKKQGLLCEHVFYYTAPPFQSNKPTPQESRFKAGYDSFMSKLKMNSNITVREGRLQKIGDSFTQKGVDTLLTMDLAQEPLKRKISTIVLLACDTDFVPILNHLRGENKIKVVLYYFNDKKRKEQFSMSNHILTACDKCFKLEESDFTENLLR